MNMPRFNAVAALSKSARSYRTGTTGGHFPVRIAGPVLNAGVIPQLICVTHHGDIVCGELEGGSGGLEGGGGPLNPGFEGESLGACRIRCFRTKTGARLRRCLADC